MQSVCEGKEFDFPAEELKTLGFWDDTDAFKQVAAERVESCRNTRSFVPLLIALKLKSLDCREQLRRTEGKKEFVFYDGPPFATGLPHYGHILAGSIKVSSSAAQSLKGDGP
jgi:isoleucyl-tRNA synthetase